MNKSLLKSFHLLECFSRDHQELSVTELSRMTGLHKSNVSRLMATLESGRLVECDPETGRYRLGLRLLSFAGVILERFDIRQTARRLMRELAQSTRETVNLSILDGFEAVHIEAVMAPQIIAHLGQVGNRLPLNCTASGRILLSYLEPAEVESYLVQHLQPLTPLSPVDPDLLRAILDQERRQGFSVATDQFIEGVAGLAVPVRNHEGKVIASLSVTGPTDRFKGKDEVFVRLLRSAARKLSEDLGHRGSARGPARRSP